MGSTFGGTWEDPGGGFFKFAVKRALKQDQIVHMEGKLQVILYFSRECRENKRLQINFSGVKNSDIVPDWKRNPMFCAKFAETKLVANIMEWHHVTVAEVFSKGVSDA